jgi:hypothetical protein
MRCWLSGAETKKQRDYFFFFKTWKVLGLVSQAQIKCWLANQTERSSKKEEKATRNRENFAAIAQRLVKKTSLRMRNIALAANVRPLAAVADQSGLSSLCRR